MSNEEIAKLLLEHLDALYLEDGNVSACKASIYAYDDLRSVGFDGRIDLIDLVQFVAGLLKQ